MQECVDSLEALQQIASELQKRAVQSERALVAASYGQDGSHRANYPPSRSATNGRNYDRHAVPGGGAPATGSGEPQLKKKSIANAPGPDEMQHIVSQIADGCALLNDCNLALLCECPSGPGIATRLREVLETLTEIAELEAKLVTKNNLGHSRTKSREAPAKPGQAAATGHDHDDRANLIANDQYGATGLAPPAVSNASGQLAAKLAVEKNGHADLIVGESQGEAGPVLREQPAKSVKAAATSRDARDSKVTLGKSQHQGEEGAAFRAEQSDPAAEISGDSQDEQMTCTSHIVALSRQASAQVQE